MEKECILPPGIVAASIREAATIPGGRIHSFSIPGFTGFVEAGAEFVHGDLPITLQLAREAGVSLVPTHHSQMTADSEKADVPFHWDEAAQRSFDSLKCALTSTPLLQPPNYNKDFLLYLAIAYLTIGMVLVQEDDVLSEYVIYYLS